MMSEINKAQIFIVSILVCSAFGILPAFANWQYTTWGMSPEEVIQASSGKAVPNNDENLNSEDSKTLLVSTYSAMGHQFDVDFMFDVNTNKLEFVKLKLVDGSRCHVLMGSLSSVYGKAADESKSAIITTARWWDKVNKNVVVFLLIGDDHCSIQYSEWRSPSESGL